MDITYYEKYEPIFGSWKIVYEIGEGSFGKVFEIQREDFGRTYSAALKVITIPKNQSEVKSAMADGMDQESVTTYFKGFVEQMVDEFALMSQLKGHSNVVSYEDHSVIPFENGIGWDILIRMELLTPLIDYVREHTLSRDEVVKLGIDICKALEACRVCKIVHRDIKPENIFVSKLGDFKLGDFGIARTAEKTIGGMSKKGTYTYMAPEVYKGEEYGPSVDIYSLGIVLYRYLNNNRTPFLPDFPAPITYTDRETSLARRMQGEVIPAPANADEPLAAIVLKACAYDPKDRYHDPAEMRAELEDLLYGRSTTGKGFAAPEDETITAKAALQIEKDGSAAEAEEEEKTASLFGTTPFADETDKKGEETKTEARAAEQTDIQITQTADEDEKTRSVFEERERKPRAVADASKTRAVIEKPEKPAKKKSIKKWCIAAAAVIVAVFACVIWAKGNRQVVMEAIAADGYHTIGLKSDGTVVVAGDDSGEYTKSEWRDIVAISAGRLHAVGLNTNGTVVATGYNGNGQCDVSGWTDIVAISAGGWHTVGLKSNGTVRAAGRNGDGQCDVIGWTDVVAIGAGSWHTVGLKSDGTVVATGHNGSGQCDVSDWTDIVAISAGEWHTVGLKSDGTVVATGHNGSGQCDVSDWTDIVTISAGKLYTVGLKSDGTVVAIGYNGSGQCDVSGWTDIAAISAGEWHTVGLKSDGTVVAVGLNSCGQCDVSGWPNTKLKK